MKSRFWIWPALALLTVAVFGQARDFEFINLDDPYYVTQNSHVVDGLSWESVIWAFSTESMGVTANWFPLTWLSLMLDVQLFGTGPAGFHVTNIVLHIGSVLILFAALNELTGAFWRSAFVTAVFAIHPLRVESVVWIAERKDVLSIMFGLLSIWWYAKAVRRRRKSWYFLSLGAFVLSLLSKQTLVTLPFVLLLLDYWPLRRLPARFYKHDLSLESAHHNTAVASEPPTLFKSGLRLAWEKVPFLAATVLFCVIAVLSQRAAGSLISAKTIPISVRCQNAIVVYAHFLWKTIWPTDLAVFYPYPTHSLIAEAAIAGLVLGFLTVVALHARWRQPYLLLGWLWYLGTFVPVIGIVQVGRQQTADRFTYFPMIGLLIAVAWLVPSLTSARWWRKRVLPALAVSTVVAFAVAAHQQTKYWRDSHTLYAHALGIVESCEVHAFLGDAFVERQQYMAASKHYQRVLQLDPNYRGAYVNLGNIYANRRQFTKAISLYQRAIDIDPTNAKVYRNLADAFANDQQIPEAITWYRKAIDLDPTDSAAYVNLGRVFANREQFNEAIAFYRQAIEIDPGNAVAHFNLGNVFAHREQFNEAIASFRKAVDLNPTMAKAHNNLGLAIIDARRATNSIDQKCLKEAIEHYRRAIELDPVSDAARNNLADAVAERQRLNKAVEPR